MKSKEKQAIIGLSFIYVARMLGLFMLMPVLALDNQQLLGSTPFLLGLAVGVYGLAQALLQFPFGSISDRMGRKPVLVFGLLLFIAGSLLGAWTDNIWGVIFARTLQGAGAVSSVLLALAGDLTGEAHRTKAMAAIGGSISIAYVLGMVLGPLIYGYSGLPGVFFWSAVLGVMALLPISFIIPKGDIANWQRMGSIQDVLRVFLRPSVQMASIGIFFLQTILGASFVVISPELLHAAQLPKDSIWKVYIPVMLAGIILMIYPVVYAEKNGQLGKMLSFSAVVLAIGALGMGLYPTHFWLIAISAVAFFTGYNIASAILPSMVSRSTESKDRGAASGVYSMMQFLGIFSGGVLGGLGLWWIGARGVFALISIVGCVLALYARISLVTNRLLRRTS
ncbi:MFS transporter [Acidithiobacillus sp. AMEEHan]|uniref:MFS transporter n=1 Tax=Acidithiobacillus sp. AMEEHan TaxID=2994951 RepID=UPI0027E404C9|nr:MFS transporter [Acidithiobacillus sp. AMEEHan]